MAGKKEGNQGYFFHIADIEVGNSKLFVMLFYIVDFLNRYFCRIKILVIETLLIMIIVYISFKFSFGKTSKSSARFYLEAAI